LYDYLITANSTATKKSNGRDSRGRS